MQHKVYKLLNTENNKYWVSLSSFTNGLWISESEIQKGFCFQDKDQAIWTKQWIENKPEFTGNIQIEEYILILNREVSKDSMLSLLGVDHVH